MLVDNQSPGVKVPKQAYSATSNQETVNLCHCPNAGNTAQKNITISESFGPSHESSVASEFWQDVLTKHVVIWIGVIYANPAKVFDKLETLSMSSYRRRCRHRRACCHRCRHRQNLHWLAVPGIAFHRRTAVHGFEITAALL